MASRRFIAAIVLTGALAPGPQSASAQSPPTLDRVLAFPTPIPGEELQADRGAAGVWLRIRKLRTTASILHVTAHPDDEHSGMLTLASRSWGARTALLSLNRGEAGANAIGPELFDALGLIRTRELVLSGRYYGLDDLYFTTAVDYGYSKSVEEAFRSWDREAVLEDMVRVIRLNRPLVVVSRFHGSRRDGHGHHHAAGLLTPEAVAAAADPARFPEQITREGLRPWRVLRVFRGGLRVDEAHHVAVGDAYSPLLGMSYQQWASLGLSLQRSQTSGRVRAGGERVYRYEQLGPGAADEIADEVDTDFFTGLDTSLPGLPGLLGEEAGDGITEVLAELHGIVERVLEEFDFNAPERSVPELLRGHELLTTWIRRARVTPEMDFHVAVKQRQFEDAIVAAAGVEVRAMLESVAGGAVVAPGEEAVVAIRVASAIPDWVLVHHSSVADASDATLAAEDVDHEWTMGDPLSALAEDIASREARMEESLSTTYDIRIRSESAVPGPYFSRNGLAENHYEVADSISLHMPWRDASLRAVVGLRLPGTSGTGSLSGTFLARTVPVTGSVPQLPYGSVARRVEVLPALSVGVSPAVRVVPARARGGSVARAEPVEVLVRLEANAPDLSAEAELELPTGWTAMPSSIRHDFRSRGEVLETPVTIQPPPDWSGDAVMEAVARFVAGADEGRPAVDARPDAQTGAPPEYRSGWQVIDHRDLPLARLGIPARTLVRSVDVASLDDLSVGYAMGVGDEVPAAIEALGATVTLLDEAALTGGELDAFDAIVVGTRAYTVRRDLVENNQRLLGYARRGGNLVVLYQTQEFVPSEMAPYPASLPRGAEEVSEEDAPVRLLAPSHALLSTPNLISEADFDSWLEQRGSKFFTEWDPAYTPLVETHDTGQEPQRGIWLTAEVGEGRYSYVALALHRQLPYGVPGAYRILSNVLWP
ncbi:MAG: PIG-L family deacetylase [Gemmatimonadota bacterium]|nr:PIG-L family deacetylase [Gemmatimonadota bacterium]